MKVLKKEKSENSRTYAFRVLLHNIITLEIIPGSAVSENELANSMQLSRTPVREALIELSKLGLVEILPQRGSYISKIDYNLIEESKFMRLVLEIAIVKLACQQGISAPYKALLKANIEEEKEAFTKHDHYQFFKLDNAFHKLLFTSVNKAQVHEFLNHQMMHFNRLRNLSLKTINYKKNIEDHENILYAIERKDEELAELLMTRHLERHHNEKEELYASYPTYFTQE